MVGGDCLMTFPFLAGTGPNFLNFGKVTRGKKMRHTNFGELEWQNNKNRGLGFDSFFERSKRGDGKKNP